MNPPIVPLTTDQLRFLSEQTDHAAKKAVRHYRNRAAAAFAILSLAVGVSFYVDAQHEREADEQNAAARKSIVDSGRAAVTIGCNRDFLHMRELRGIIEEGNAQIKVYVQEGTLTPAQGQRAIAKGREALERVPLPDCREAQRAINDDPERDVKVPSALWSGTEGRENKKSSRP